MAENQENDNGFTENDAAKDQRGNIIKVSNTKKPISFYLNLAKKHLKIHDDVELAALGMAIPTVVTICEILKRNGLAAVKSISTSTVVTTDEKKGRMVNKSGIEIRLIKLSSEHDKEGLEKGQEERD